MILEILLDDLVRNVGPEGVIVVYTDVELISIYL